MMVHFLVVIDNGNMYYTLTHGSDVYFDRTIDGYLEVKALSQVIRQSKSIRHSFEMIS